MIWLQSYPSNEAQATVAEAHAAELSGEAGADAAAGGEDREAPPGGDERVAAPGVVGVEDAAVEDPGDAGEGRGHGRAQAQGREAEEEPRVWLAPPPPAGWCHVNYS